MDKAIFELAEKLHHPSDIGTKLDAVEKSVKEEYEQHEDNFKRRLMLGYEHMDDIGRKISDITKIFSKFKLAESKSVEILRNFTSLVKDYKTVKVVCQAHQRFVKVKDFVERLQAVDEECACEDIGEYHDRVYGKEEFMFELEMYNDGLSSENFARVQHAVSTIQRFSADFRTVLVEMVSDIRECQDQVEKLNKIVEREEKRDEITRLAQEGDSGQDPELQALALMCPQYLTRKPKELRKALISAIHGSIESKFAEIDTEKAFVGSLSFVLEDLEFIDKEVKLDFFTFDDALMTYHRNLKKLIDQTIERLDAGEILSLIEYKMDYYNRIEASYGRVSEALGPHLIEHEAELLEKYAAAAAAKLQQWIENITTTELEKFTAREGGIARDEEDRLVSTGFVGLLQLIKVQLEPISFNKKVFLHIAQTVKRNCMTFQSKIIAAIERDLPQACAGKGKPGFEDYCIMFGNSGLRLTQYITSLPECQSPEIKQLGNIFMGILRSCNHFLAEFILATCAPAVKQFFTDDWRNGMRIFSITIEDFLQDYEKIMAEFSFTTLISEIAMATVAAYAKRLRSKRLSLRPECAKLLKEDHSSLLSLLSSYGDKEALSEILKPLLRVAYIMESTSEELITAEANSLKLAESAIDCATLCSLVENRKDLSEDMQKRLAEGIKDVFSSKKGKQKKRTFMSKFLSK